MLPLLEALIRFRIPILLAILASGAFFLGRWCVTIAKDNEALRSQILEAERTISQYKEGLRITEDAQNEYQDTINRLNADLKRLRANPVRCHTVAAPAGDADESPAGEQLPVGNGLRSDWLYDFAGRCEGERLKVLGLQNFINKMYERGDP